MSVGRGRTAAVAAALAALAAVPWAAAPVAAAPVAARATGGHPWRWWRIAALSSWGTGIAGFSPTVAAGPGGGAVVDAPTGTTVPGRFALANVRAATGPGRWGSSEPDTLSLSIAPGGIWDVFFGAGRTWGVAVRLAGRFHVVPELSAIGLSGPDRFGWSSVDGASAVTGAGRLWLLLRRGSVPSLVSIAGDGRTVATALPGLPTADPNEALLASGPVLFLRTSSRIIAYRVTASGAAAREGELSGDFRATPVGLRAVGDGRGGLWFVTPVDRGFAWMLHDWDPAGRRQRLWLAPRGALGTAPTPMPSPGGSWLLLSCIDQCGPPPPPPQWYALDARARWRRVPLPPGALGYLTAVAPDGTLWAGLGQGGVAQVAPAGTARIDRAGWPSGYAIQDLTVDPAGTVWATAARGAHGPWIVAELPAAPAGP